MVSVYKTFEKKFYCVFFFRLSWKRPCISGWSHISSRYSITGANGVWTSCSSHHGKRKETYSIRWRCWRVSGLLKAAPRRGSHAFNADSDAAPEVLRSRGRAASRKGQMLTSWWARCASRGARSSQATEQSSPGWTPGQIDWHSPRAIFPNTVHWDP